MSHWGVLRPHPIGAGARKAFIALTRAAIPPGETLNAAIDGDEIGDKVALALAAMAPEGRLMVWLSLHLFNWLSVFRYAQTFSRLNAENQKRWLLSWVDSRWAPFRMSSRLLLTLVKPIHLANRAVQRQLEYEPTETRIESPSPPFSLPSESVVTALEGDRQIKTQVVVIGSGAGGAVVAAELAERGIDVVIIEAGRFFSSSNFGRDPLAVLREVYQDGATTVALGKPSIPIPLGKTVGGTTTINSGTCFRVPDRILDKWDTLGLSVDRTALNAAFKRVEERISVKPVPDHLLGGSSHVIARGAEALGLEHGPLKRNIAGCHMSGVCALGCPREAKQSMNLTYIPRALEHGARLYSGFKAETITIRNGRAGGVVARQVDGGPELTITADAVVSACGAIGGVPFLAKNGIRSKHLGRHLSLHPAGKIAAIMPDVVDGWRDTPQGYAIYELFDQGVMFEGAFVPPELASIAMPFAGDAFTRVMEEYRNLAMFGLLVADEPNGRVRPGPGGRPLITYWMGKSDLEKLRTGLIMLSEVFFAAGAQRIFLPISGFEEHATMDEAMKILSKPLDGWRLELAAFHPLGTARMSTSARHGVIKPDLETWEMPGLYVIDGSIFPSSLGVNPQLSIMAYATRAAAEIAQRLSAQ